MAFGFCRMDGEGDMGLAFVAWTVKADGIHSGAFWTMRLPVLMSNTREASQES